MGPLIKRGGAQFPYEGITIKKNLVIIYAIWNISIEKSLVFKHFWSRGSLFYTEDVQNMQNF